MPRTTAPRDTPPPLVPGRPPAWRRRLHRHRGPLAALLAALLVWSLTAALRPAPPSTVPVLVATRDLPPGTRLSESDLAVAQRPEESRPADSPAGAEALVGRTVVVPVLAGEPVLARHLLTGALLAGYGDDVVATPVRLSDDAAAAVVRPGDVVDVVAATPGDVASGGRAVTVASRVRVLLAGGEAVDSGGGGLLSAPSTSGGSGAVLVLATTTAQALEVARAAVSSRLTVVLRGG